MGTQSAAPCSSESCNCNTEKAKMDKEWQPMNFGSILDSIETRYYAPGDPRLLLQQNERTTRPKSREELVLPPLVQQPWQKHLNARGGSIAVNRQKIEQMNKRNEQESTCSYKELLKQRAKPQPVEKRKRPKRKPRAATPEEVKPEKSVAEKVAQIEAAQKAARSRAKVAKDENLSSLDEAQESSVDRNARIKEYEQQMKDRSQTSLALRSIRQAEQDAANSQQAAEASKPLTLKPPVLQKKDRACHSLFFR